jgi:hypothetical protein
MLIERGDCNESTVLVAENGLYIAVVALFVETSFSSDTCLGVDSFARTPFLGVDNLVSAPPFGDGDLPTTTIADGAEASLVGNIRSHKP